MLKEWKAKLDAAIKAHPKGKPLNKDGSEIPNPIPMDPPIGYKKQPTMFEVMRNMIREEKIKNALEAEGYETPEESDDFDVGDEYEPTSPYEHDFDHVADPGELQRLRDAIDIRERALRADPFAASTSTNPLSSTPSPNTTADPGGQPASTSGPGVPPAPSR